MHIYILYIYLFINIYNIYIYALKGGLAGQKYKSEIFLRTRGPISKNQSIHLSPSWQPQGNDTESSLDLFGEQTHEDWASPKPPKIDQSSSIHVRINILIDSPVSSSMVYIHYHSVNSLPIFGTRNHFDLAQSYSKFGPSSSIHHYNRVFHSLDLWKNNLFGPCHVRPIGPTPLPAALRDWGHHRSHTPGGTSGLLHSYGKSP